MPYKDPEKKKEYLRKYYQANKERQSEYYKNRFDNNPELRERKKQYLKEYYQDNKEKYSGSWERITSDPETHEKYKENRRKTGAGTKSYRSTRKKILEHLGNKCNICGSTENLEVNHRNLADTELRRTTSKSHRCKPGLRQIQNNEVDVELLCHDCHMKWSCAQRKAAMALFSSQSVEEQIKLTQKFFQ